MVSEFSFVHPKYHFWARKDGYFCVDGMTVPFYFIFLSVLSEYFYVRVVGHFAKIWIDADAHCKTVSVLSETETNYLTVRKLKLNITDTKKEHVEDSLANIG